jgi:alginate O-acetyltransferase complex protein AlgI
MIFSEPRFLLFFLLVFSVHWALRSNAARKHVLLAASLYFYGSWDARFLALIVAASLCDWFCSLRIAAARARGAQPRRWLMVSLCYNLGTLGFFKYFNFFADSAVAFLQWLGLPASPVTLQIVLPVGISFFTFQTMSYTLDVWRGDLKPVRSPLDFLLYVTFFPQLVAGPIVRAATFLPQLDVARRFRDVDVQRAVGQFLSGFIKKSVVADLIAGPVDQVFGPPAGVVVPPGEAFGPPADYSAASIWIAVVCYAVQIYCDFSGYSDMAIGAARLLGYELCENFRFPYLAANITDFWRRWHMSLSSWLRDYLYISLGGNRGSRWFTHRNLMLTMLLGGLWHGAGWTFVVWGAIHGVALVAHKEWLRLVGPGRLSLLARPLTLYTVVLAWIFFRARTWEDSWVMAKAWLFLGSPGATEVDLGVSLVDWPLGVRCAVVFGALFALHFAASRRWHEAIRRALPSWLVTLLFGAIAAIALSCVPLQARPFIYFQF